MDLKITNTHLTIFLTLLFASIFSTSGAQENPLVKAIKLYDTKEYQEAEKILKPLLKENPEHLMVNYYYGACRTETNNFGSKEIQYLSKGSTGEAPLKTDYYLGVQYHAQNQWEEALKHYINYQKTTGENEQNEVHLSEKIQQCYDKNNPFVNETDIEEAETNDIMPAPLPRENEIEEYNPVIAEELLEDSIKTDSITVPESLEISESLESEKTSVPIVTPQTIIKAEPISFIINGEITYLDTSHFRTEEGLNDYLEGNKNKKKLDAQLKEVDELRKKYGEARSYDEKQEIGEKILKAENNNYSLQNETQELFAQAKQAEINYWETVSFEDKEAFRKELANYSKSLQKTEDPVKTKIDTSTFIDPDLLLGAPEINPKTEEGAEDELIYRIQLGAYSRELPTYVKNQFKKLSYIRKIENYTDDKGVVVYTTGNLTKFEDALKMQNQVRQEGVEDAFVVPYFNGKRITLKEAKEIEAGK